MIRVFEICERLGKMFYKFVCSTFWGLGLMDKQRMVGLDRLHSHISKNRKVERAKAEENGWVVFRHSYSPMH
jgi:hypothetical protein